MTAFAGGNAILVAGLEHQVVISDSAFALAWDTRTGEKLGRSELGANRRAWASATSFGDDALVAGGIDNVSVPPKVIGSALVFRNGAVEREEIPLGDPRARHGATVLADGSTLLVGGEDESHLALPPWSSLHLRGSTVWTRRHLRARYAAHTPKSAQRPAPCRRHDPRRGRCRQHGSTGLDAGVVHERWLRLWNGRQVSSRAIVARPLSSHVRRAPRRRRSVGRHRQRSLHEKDRQRRLVDPGAKVSP